MAFLLVVDDDRDIGDTIAEVLRTEDHEVWVARNGQEGLALLETRHPDLVLMDVEMPLVSGPDMASLMILRNMGKEKIPVVFLSGIVGLPEIARAMGTPYFLAKPYAIKDVLALVERALRERIAPRPGGIERATPSPGGIG